MRASIVPDFLKNWVNLLKIIKKNPPNFLRFFIISAFFDKIAWNFAWIYLGVFSICEEKNRVNMITEIKMAADYVIN